MEPILNEMKKMRKIKLIVLAPLNLTLRRVEEREHFSEQCEIDELSGLTMHS